MLLSSRSAYYLLQEFPILMLGILCLFNELLSTSLEQACTQGILFTVLMHMCSVRTSRVKDYWYTCQTLKISHAMSGVNIQTSAVMRNICNSMENAHTHTHKHYGSNQNIMWLFENRKSFR